MSFLELFKRPALIGAHRGFLSNRPENTLSALNQSIGHCDFIEVDVQLSREGIAVIIHDDTLERTTNVKQLKAYKTRIPYKVTDFTYAELSDLDYGSWFYINVKRPEPLLTLKKVLEFVKENQIYLNLEIKDLSDTFSDMQVVSSVLKEIEASDSKDFILLSSFRHEYMQLGKQIQPDLPTAALVEDKHPNPLIPYLKSIGVDAYHFNDALVDETTVKKLKEAGYYINIYTVNDFLRRQQLFDMGVNGVFTDYLE
ncbi:MAG: glycerophosphodiester phosphodiesterase family protein [Sulfurimonas sp.]|jgi:glycerophosphoryl diester phosphodiesterase|nr:glycerophosphodiester phosphodiesterase family protein [Sulfurimonas sp.]